MFVLRLVNNGTIKTGVNLFRIYQVQWKILPCIGKTSACKFLSYLTDSAHCHSKILCKKTIIRQTQYTWKNFEKWRVYNKAIFGSRGCSSCRSKRTDSRGKKDSSKKKDERPDDKRDNCKKKDEERRETLRKREASKKKEDHSEEKKDPCRKKEDRTEEKKDHCRKKEDRSEDRRDYCKKRLEQCEKREDKKMSQRDPATEQLHKYKKENAECGLLTTGHGAPIDDKLNSLTIGPRGPILLQDTTYIDEITHFDRERIPERVVHAKGAGAFGYFEVTHDITHICKANVFCEIGKRTPIAVRFSTVGGESGSADTVRDPRGFAVKFYTEEGNWDLVGNNTPIFFIRDPIFFPSFIHTQKRNPATHLKDPDMFWDFISLRPETTHQVMFLFSDRGIPDGYRHMNGYGSHTFKLVNDKNEAVYCKFHYKTDQGIRNIPSDKAAKLSAEDPDYAIRDLYNAIENGDCPSWTFYIQVMTFAEAEQHEFNPFDVTKVWSHKDFPLCTVGKLVLNRNPKNYFAEVEQLAFSPSHLVPGIEPSPDKMLQGRLFSYPDTHRHRLGANYLQIPVNSPYKSNVQNYQRDGPYAFGDNQGGAPNYYPNSFNGPVDDKKYRPPPVKVSGDVARYNSADDDNFTQANDFYCNVLNDDERARLIENIADHLKHAAKFIQERAVRNFCNVNEEFAECLKEKLNLTNMGSKI